MQVGRPAAGGWVQWGDEPVPPYRMNFAGRGSAVDLEGRNRFTAPATPTTGYPVVGVALP